MKTLKMRTIYLLKTLKMTMTVKTLMIFPTRKRATRSRTPTLPRMLLTWEKKLLLQHPISRGAQEGEVKKVGLRDFFLLRRGWVQTGIYSTPAAGEGRGSGRLQSDRAHEPQGNPPLLLQHFPAEQVMFVTLTGSAKRGCGTWARWW